jgi:hypothetical protein
MLPKPAPDDFAGLPLVRRNLQETVVKGKFASAECVRAASIRQRLWRVSDSLCRASHALPARQAILRP